MSRNYTFGAYITTLPIFKIKIYEGRTSSAEFNLSRWCIAPVILFFAVYALNQVILNIMIIYKMFFDRKSMTDEQIEKMDHEKDEIDLWNVDFKSCKTVMQELREALKEEEVEVSKYQLDRMVEVSNTSFAQLPGDVEDIFQYNALLNELETNFGILKERLPSKESKAGDDQELLKSEKNHTVTKVDSTVKTIQAARRWSLGLALGVLLLQCLTIAGVSYSFFELRILMIYNPYQVILRTFFSAAIFMLCLNEKSIIHRQNLQLYRRKFNFDLFMFLCLVRTLLMNFSQFILLAYIFTDSAEEYENIMD
jgi:hypothetical protein